MLRGFSNLSGEGCREHSPAVPAGRARSNSCEILIAPPTDPGRVGYVVCRHAGLHGACSWARSGCALIFPDVSHEPVVHNPFPQLNKVAVAPFFNQSDETTVDGRKFALAYFAELQTVPGFEVVPLGVVEEAIIEHQVDLSRPGEARRLAKILGVDAVVVGSVTDYTPYYPPRCGLRVEWYAANPGFHEIPPGYGLPWGTPEEEYIPAPLVFESEFALAKAQLATQTPACDMQPIDPPATAATTGRTGSVPRRSIRSRPPRKTPAKTALTARRRKTRPPTPQSLPPTPRADGDSGHVAQALYEESSRKPKSCRRRQQCEYAVAVDAIGLRCCR